MACARSARLGVGGSCVRLLVVAILQTVLRAAQEDVRVAQGGGRRPRQEAARFEGRKRRQRTLSAQRVLAAATHDLQGLHDELDFADAAVAQLDIGQMVAPRGSWSRIWRCTSRSPSYAS
jgi:hypothetical protein